MEAPPFEEHTFLNGSMAIFHAGGEAQERPLEIAAGSGLVLESAAFD